MSITVAAEGTWLVGNNAALTPTVPGTPQTGDTVICIGFVRENGATLAISGAGTTWTLIGTHASPANEMRASVWRAPWASGMANPTVTPTGSGSNDTTLATCILLRGNLYSTTLLFGDTVTTAYSMSEYSGSALVLGDSCLSVIFSTVNEGTPSMYADASDGSMIVQYETSSPQRFWYNGVSTATGSDAAGTWGLLELPQAFDGSTSWLRIRPTLTQSNQIEFRIKFNSDAPTNLPPSFAMDAITELVIRHAGLVGQPAAYQADCLLDFILGWAGTIEGIEQRRWAADISLLIGGSLTVTKGPAPAYEPYYGIAPSWDAAGDPGLDLREWSIAVTLDGVSVPATSATIRRNLGAVSLTVAIAKQIVAVTGATLLVTVTFRNGLVLPVSGLVVGSIFTQNESVVYAQSLEPQSSGVAWFPAGVSYRSNSRIRTGVDWFVRPGDSVEGATINEVVTVLGGKSWMTEVGYG